MVTTAADEDIRIIICVPETVSNAEQFLRTTEQQ